VRKAVMYRKNQETRYMDMDGMELIYFYTNNSLGQRIKSMAILLHLQEIIPKIN
jgi:hypothetical protein